MSKILPISEAAGYLGVSSKTLRRWEDRGRISPLRTTGGQRRYLFSDLESLKTPPNNPGPSGVNGEETKLILARLDKLEENLSRSIPAVGQNPAQKPAPVPPAPPSLPTLPSLSSPISPIPQHSHPAPAPRSLGEGGFAGILVSFLLFVLLVGGAVSAFYYRPELVKKDVLNPLVSSLLAGGGKVEGTMRFLSTIFFGETDSYFVSPLGEASFRNLRAKTVISDKQEAISFQAESITTDDLIVKKSQTIANLNSDFLDSLDSTSFLRSDTSATFSSGTLTLASGTAFQANGTATFGSTLAVSGKTDLSGLLNVAGLLTAANGLTLSAGALTLPAASIADSYLSANVPLKNTANTFTAAQTVSNANLLVTGTGNVGIGTTGPGTKVQIGQTGSGSYSLDIATNERNRGYDWYLNGARRMGIDYMADTDLISIVDWTAPAERVVFTRTGNVGIGTTGPASLITLNAAAGANGTPIEFDIAGVAKSYIGVAGQASSIIFGSVAGDTAIRNQGNNILFSTDSGATSQLYLKNGGNVGIGTAAPTAKLQVAGTSLLGGVTSLEGSNPVAGIPYSLLVDEATTNSILNPSFEVDTSNWSAVGTANLTRTTASGEFFIGTAGLKTSIPTGAALHGAKHANIPAVAGQRWAASAWLKTSVAKIIRLTIAPVDGAGADLAGSITTEVTASTTFTRYSVSHRVGLEAALPTGTAAIRVQITNNGADQGAFDIFADGVQAELKADPGTYADGSLGPGYAWTGTAHASTSTRTGGVKYHNPFTSLSSPSPFAITPSGYLEKLFISGRDQYFLNESAISLTNTALGVIGSQTYSDRKTPSSFANIELQTADPWFTGQIVFKTNNGDGTNSAPTERMRITNAGNVGIGITNPTSGLIVANSRLQVTANATPTTGAGIELGYNAASNTGNVAAFDRGASVYKTLTLTGSTVTVDISGAQVASFGTSTTTLDIGGTGTANAVCHTTQTGTNDEGIVDCTSAPIADYAEMYPVSLDADYGDLVATGGESVNTYSQDNGQVLWDKVEGKVSRLVKTDKGYQGNLIGVVSNNYGDFTSAGHNIKASDNPKPVSLNGRVLVKVSTENGVINPGDPLTSSATIPGYAMKATSKGRTIGIALEPLTEGTGKLMVFINPSWYDPGTAVDTDGQLMANGKKLIAETVEAKGGLFETITATISAVFEKLTAKTAEIATAVIENLTAKRARVNELEMVDKATGEVYCTWLENGDWQKVKGQCSSIETIGD